MKVTKNLKGTRTNYKWVERNISKIGPKTYRVRVGSYDGYASTRDSARSLKRKFLSKV